MTSVAVESTADAAARLAADRIAAMIVRRPQSTVGLATGQTMKPVYAELVRRHRQEGLAFGGLTVFALDEYLGAPPDHPGSCAAFLDRLFLSVVDVHPARVHLLNGLATDPQAECDVYERAIASAGGLDLQLLGIGANGHIGFNEPGSPFESRTRVVALANSTRLANVSKWGGAANVPAQALTMGLATILEARTCLLVATGAAKARAVVQALEGEITPLWPASVLRAHAEAAFVLDESAASQMLKMGD